MSNLYCYDPRHAVPCPQPCAACEDECPPAEVREGTAIRLACANDLIPPSDDQTTELRKALARLDRTLDRWEAAFRIGRRRR